MELAPQVEDLAKAIHSLPSIFDAVYSLPISGWLVVAAFFLWFLANRDFTHIFDVLERKEKRRLEVLDKYVSTETSADNQVMSAIKDLRDAYYFKVATGIYAESRIRNALIKLHEANCHLITWHNICRAQPYLDVNKDENVTVRKLSSIENFSYWYNQLVAYFFLLLSAALFSLLLLVESKTLTAVTYSFGGGILTALFAMFAYSQNYPVRAAKKIRDELERQSQEINATQPSTTTA